jgi:hypothetical protein
MAQQSGFSALILACAAAVRGIGSLIEEDQAKAREREGNLRKELDKAREQITTQNPPAKSDEKPMGASGLTLKYVQDKVNEACTRMNERLQAARKQYGEFDLPSGTINTQTMETCHKSLLHLAEQNKLIDAFIEGATTSTKEQELRALIAELAPDK